jgi:hypothetical protein
MSEESKSLQQASVAVFVVIGSLTEHNGEEPELSSVVDNYQLIPFFISALVKEKMWRTFTINFTLNLFVAKNFT